MDYKKLYEQTLAENKELKENQLTEESAIDYVYNHSSRYEDWVMGSDIYLKLKEENDELIEINEREQDYIDDENTIVSFDYIAGLKKQVADLEHKIAICEAEQEEEANLYQELKEKNRILDEQIDEKQDYINDLENMNTEQKLTIDCHLAELGFTNANALDEPRAFNNWLESHYDEERYQQMYDWINLSEYLDEED
jgi:hypothetical protein